MSTIGWFELKGQLCMGTRRTGSKSSIDSGIVLNAQSGKWFGFIRTQEFKEQHRIKDLYIICWTEMMKRVRMHFCVRHCKNVVPNKN